MINRLLNLLAICILCFTAIGYGQTQTDTGPVDIEHFFNFWINLSGIEFSMPDGYKKAEVDDTKRYWPTKTKYLASYLHTIINAKHDIMIGMYALPIPKEEYTEKDKKFYRAIARMNDPDKVIPDDFFDRNTEWKIPIDQHIDSLASPVYFPISDDQKKKLNADTVVMFQMKIDEERAFQGKYNRCRYIVMHKDTTGDGTILYFYNAGNEHLVDEEIHRTWGLLRFTKEEK